MSEVGVSAIEPARLELPPGKSLGAWVVPNVEWFPLERTVPGGAGVPFDMSAWSIREYGNRRGFWRLVKVFDETQVTPTVALNSDVCRHHPEIISAGVERSWEWMGHGITNTDFSVGLSEEEEWDLIDGSLVAIGAATGVRPRGWLTPHFAQNAWTPRLLKRAGIAYVTDWMIDDRPLWLKGEGFALSVLPYNLEINDKHCYEALRMTTKEYLAHCLATFDALYEESEEEPRTLAIAVHTYLSGYPARASVLQEVLAYVSAKPGVFMGTASDIVGCVH